MKSIGRLLDFLGRYGWTTTLVILAVIALGFTWSTSDELFSTIRLFDRIALIIDQNYVERVDRSKLVKAGVDGMLEKLDKYTRYLDGSDFLRLQQTTDGKIDGIGIYLDYHHDTLTVTSVLEGTPGQRAGILPGDRVLMIDSLAATGLDMNDIRPLMAGKKGTAIEILISRPGENEFRVSALREEMDIESIPYSGLAADKIGYIMLSRFSDKCASNMRESIGNLKQAGMTSLILDLRGNPGGLLSEAIETAGLFLPRDVPIVDTRGRDGMLIASYYAYGNPAFVEGDIAVIIDEYTASAAEIVAGAIQDHDRGVIIGTPSYGKGMVQQVLMVSDDSALKITTSRYHLPSGRCLQKPDWSDFDLMPGGEKYDDSDSIYFTAGGRPVFGGGGIIPDILLDENLESDYLSAVEREFLLFDFAAGLIRTADVDIEFKPDDKIMADFKAFIESAGFDFENEERNAYNDLKNSLRGGDSEAKKALETLDRGIDSREKWYFESNYSALAEKLEENVINMKFGETSWLETRVSKGPPVNAAVEILSNDHKYSAIFGQR